MRAGAFPPLERPDHFPKPIPESRSSQNGALCRDARFFARPFGHRMPPEPFPAFGAGIELHDALSPGFISSIFDESGLQRTVSGTPRHPDVETQKRLPTPEIL